MLAAVDPGAARARAVPARRADEGRRRAPRRPPPASRPRRGAESQEACFLAGDDYRAFLERQGLARRAGADRRRGRRELGRHDGLLALHARPAARARRRGARAALRAAHGRGDATPSSSGRATALARDARSRLAGAARRRRPTPRRSCGTAPRPSPRPSVETDDGFALELDEPAYGVAPGQVAVLYDDDAVVGAGVDHGRRLTERLGFRAMTVLARHAGDVLDYALCGLLRRELGVGLALPAHPARRHFGGSRRSSGAPSATLLPVDRQGRRNGRPRERPARQARHRDGQRGRRWRTAPTPPCARSRPRSRRPVKKVAGFAAGVSHGFSAFRARRDAGEAVARREGRALRGARASSTTELRNAGQAEPDDAPPPAA